MAARRRLACVTALERLSDAVGPRDGYMVAHGIYSRDAMSTSVVNLIRSAESSQGDLLCVDACWKSHIPAQIGANSFRQVLSTIGVR